MHIHLDEPTVVCTECLHGFDAKARSTFLGFRKYECPSCGVKVVHDLRMTPRVIYWFLSIPSGSGAVMAVLAGNFPVSAPFFLLMISTLIRDRIKARNERHAWDRADEAAALKASGVA